MGPRPASASGLFVVLVTLLAPWHAGCGTHRPPRDEPALLALRGHETRRFLDETRERYTTVLRRAKAQLDEYNAGRRPRPPVIDYLVISGGGDVGAFGAGFLKGWAGVPKTDPLARPRFDVTTGVSTGALIAPFAYLDDAVYDERIVRLYRNPRKDWVKERWPLFFLPSNLSFAEVPGLERELRENVTPEMVARIGGPENEGRILFVSATNLDDGSPRRFYLRPEAARATATGDVDRIHQILLASSGIPAAFPYREIDGAMYVDGAVTANMVFGGRLPEEYRFTGLWAQLYPDTPMPKLRYWVIFNNQLRAVPTTVRARWLDITMRTVEVSSRAASLNGIRLLFGMAEVARLRRGYDVEVRYVAVPDDWRPPKAGSFLKETMNSLADLGERMGADPRSWRTEPPM